MASGVAEQARDKTEGRRPKTQSRGSQPFVAHAPPKHL